LNPQERTPVGAARRLGRRAFLTSAWWLVAAAPSLVLAEPAPKTVRLLTVGNSFSRNATHYLDDLAKAAGDVLIHRPIVVGGASLELHWTKAEKHEQDPQDEQGRYAGGRSLKDELRAEPWGFVSIQQASIKSHDITTYRPFARQLVDYIRLHAPGAEVLIHQTWEYRCDDPRFKATAKKNAELPSSTAMYEALTAAYATIARELGLRLIPVGDAFHLASRDPQWGFRPPAAPFDPKTAKPPDLPDQTHSLHVGWKWSKGKDGTMKLGLDGHHANVAGEYLGACVWYEMLFGRSVQGNPFVPKNLDPAFAKFLQETAHRAVALGSAR
jgi:hypothetical protein